MEGFQDIVKTAWAVPAISHDKARCLHIKLARTPLALKAWHKASFSSVNLQMAVATEIIGRIDVAQESRALSPAERSLRASMRAKFAGLAVISKIRIRQQARVNTIKLGDVNSRFFHIRANGRRRKNFIQSLASPSSIAISHEEKENVIWDHFMAFLGTASPRSVGLNWAALGYVPNEALLPLDAPFTLDEIKATVFDLPAEKAPGPDGFTGRFFRACLETIKDALQLTIDGMANSGGHNSGLVNSSNVILLPKKEVSSGIGDYRPIRLIHSLAKIFSKLMSCRLAPLLPSIVSVNQLAFVKKRCIHDNFVLVQGIIRDMRKKGEVSCFLKLDISKAFDSVSWPFLLELLGVLGFRPKWRQWVCMLLSSPSSRIILNGIPGPWIQHARGLRQGDPLSLMLFILAIDPLHHILRRATEMAILNPFRDGHVRVRVSLYADAAGIFTCPEAEDLAAINRLLHLFRDASGLRTNLDKSELFPIGCSEVQALDALRAFPTR